MPAAGVAGSTYQVIFQSLPLAAVLLDEHLRVLLANPAASDLFDMPQGRLQGTALTSIIPHRSLPALVRDFDGSSGKVFEIHLAPEGSLRRTQILKITAVRLAQFTGRPAPRELRLLLIEDVGEKVSLEQQLVETEKLAGMGQLAAGIAHELANPLTSIASNLLFVRDGLTGNGNSHLLEPLDATLERVDHMRQLLCTLAGFTRHQRPTYELADINDVVRRTVVFIAKDAERRGIELAASFAPSLPACYVDVRVMDQVLLNLFKNAIEAMPSGGLLEVRTRHLAKTEEILGGAVIQVADTGIGIAEADLRNVFRPLFSTKPRGTGLGLSFCRKAVEEHGGEIRLESRQGLGTTVTLILPTDHDRIMSKPFG